MSKIGRLPIAIPQGVTLTQEKDMIHVQGTKGTLTQKVPHGIIVQIADGTATVSLKEKSALEDKKQRAIWGLMRALIANMVVGVSTGFVKKLELAGVGYRAQATGSDLTLSVGFSHPVKIKGPQGVTFAVDGNTITVSGIDKTLLGDVAAKIRAIRKPEPYKGKGIKYQGERIRRKAGKAAKAVGGTAK